MVQIENGINGGTDIPEELAVSSVGAIVWPPIEASEQRKKGIYHSVIEHPYQLRSLLEEFHSFPLDVQTTRYSARLFITQERLREIEETDRLYLDQYLEGIIPLCGSGVQELEDCCMIYVGKNSVARTHSYALMEQELSLARQIFADSENSASHNPANFEFEILTAARKQDRDIKNQFCDLYSAFGYNPGDVDEILTSPNNVIVAAFDSSVIASSGLGERAEFFIRRSGKNVRFVMYEVTEAATRELYRGNGLYTHVAFALMRHLAQTDANLIYAESNLEAPGVLKAAKRQGRHSVLETFDQYGFIPRPLQQHVRISPGHSDTRATHLKNDLLVTFLPRNELIQLYGPKNS